MNLFEQDPTSIDLPADIHTFSVVPSPEAAADRYLGFAGPVGTGEIDVWESTDLANWDRTEPLSLGSDFRWPSLVVRDGTYYMAVRERDENVQSRIRRIISRRVPGRTHYDRTHISLYRSSDGNQFTPVGPAVQEGRHGHTQNQNPFLFVDPACGELLLVYFSGNPYGDDRVWQIRAARIDPDGDPVRTDDRVLVSETTTTAAPGVFYHAGAGQYVLLVERKVAGEWEIAGYASETPCGDYEALPGNPLLSGDIACPFPFVTDETMYLFTSERRQDRWYGKLFVYEMNGGR